MSEGYYPGCLSSCGGKNTCGRSDSAELMPIADCSAGRDAVHLRRCIYRIFRFGSVIYFNRYSATLFVGSVEPLVLSRSAGFIRMNGWTALGT